MANPQGSARTDYLYSADGMKRRVVRVTAAATKTTDYAANKVYEDGVLKRILVNGGYYDMTTAQYCYYLTDHLGNNRGVADAGGLVIQQNHYDPYGSLLAESSGGPAQPCKYNGKELDGELGLGLYDYQARNMDPVLGRFTTIEARPGGVTIYGSARDVGNWGAGFVAGKSGMSWQMARLGFDALQTYQKGIRNGWDVEGRPSQLAQQIGYRLGSWLYQQRNVQTNFRSLINRPTWSSNSY